MIFTKIPGMLRISKRRLKVPGNGTLSSTPDRGRYESMYESKTSDLLQRIQEWKEGSYSCLDQDLHEMGPEIIPKLIEFFRAEKDKDTRAFLVEVIYQFREREAIPFLAEALWDDSPLVWQIALDGLLTLDLPECIQVMEQARTRTFRKKKDSKHFQGFLEEAIQMLREGVWDEKKDGKSPPGLDETD